MTRRRTAPRRAARCALLLLLTGVTGCGRAASRTLVLATTTSVEDSGLLAALVPAFEAAHAGVHVRVIAVGSGQALALGQRGDADVLLVHAPADEARFVAAGHGARRAAVMENDFVVVGPRHDPANVRGSLDAAAALRTIAARNAPWVSRGDSSGTHRAELRLRERARVTLRVLEVGQGMAETLVFAGERDAYTLTDRGTYVTLRDQLPLAILVEGDTALRNPYSIVVVRNAANREHAQAFADWITAPPAQQLIAEFGHERYGRALFQPAAIPITHDGSAAR